MIIRLDFTQTCNSWVEYGYYQTWSVLFKNKNSFSPSVMHWLNQWSDTCYTWASHWCSIFYAKLGCFIRIGACPGSVFGLVATKMATPRAIILLFISGCNIKLTIVHDNARKVCKNWWGQGRAQGKRRFNMHRFKNCDLVLMSDLLCAFDRSF